MLDVNQPHDVFTGKDDLYRLLRETRAAINLLSSRFSDIEDRLDGGDGMANTVSNSSMRPTVQIGKGGRNGGGKNK